MGAGEPSVLLVSSMLPAAAVSAAAVAPVPAEPAALPVEPATVVLPMSSPVSSPVSSMMRDAMGSSHTMLPLYISTAAMQVLDVLSTRQALKNGAVEGNPVMAGMTSHQAVFFAVKAGIAASTIMAARSMAKHNKVAAMLTLVGINSAYAMVVSHNFKLAHALGQR